MKKFSLLLLLCTLTAVYSQAPDQFHVGRFGFTIPPGWGWDNPSSAMRKAQLSLPGGKGEVTFFHFGPGEGGSVESNVQRWAAQFGGAEASNAKTAVQDYKGSKVTYVSAKGTFNSGMPGGPTTPLPNYALLGAILEDKDNGDVYVKMTGPADAVTANTVAFQKMIQFAAENK